MNRITGTFQQSKASGEIVKAFVPNPLPPTEPALNLDERLLAAHEEALRALEKLNVAGAMVPSAQWFLYGFVRKEALVSSQIEGTQATLQDVVTYEATSGADRPEDVREVCNYLDAIEFARAEIAKPDGLPLSTRLLCQAHERLMRGTRGAEKMPGEIRRSQNWIGGSRPGNAHFVPPPPEMVSPLMGQLEHWLYSDDPLPPLVKAGLAHVQFETIHPFLDGNGRIGRLLIALLLEHWKLLSSPLLYLSLALKRRQPEYYARLSDVRAKGDWENWTLFFLECVRDAANDGVWTAERVFARVGADRALLLSRSSVTVAALRLFELLPSHPVVTLPLAMDLLKVSKPTCAKAIDALVSADLLRETSGKKRDRAYAYQRYLDELTREM